MLNLKSNKFSWIISFVLGVIAGIDHYSIPHLALMLT